MATHMRRGSDRYKHLAIQWLRMPWLVTNNVSYSEPTMSVYPMESEMTWNSQHNLASDKNFGSEITYLYGKQSCNSLDFITVTS